MQYIIIDVAKTLEAKFIYEIKIITINPFFTVQNSTEPSITYPNLNSGYEYHLFYDIKNFKISSTPSLILGHKVLQLSNESVKTKIGNRKFGVSGVKGFVDF